MKRIAVFLLMILSYGNLNAQEVSYWVGRSANADPIMRHHEAFMDAFMQYAYYNKPIQLTGENNDNKSHFLTFREDSCRLQSVASITTPEGIEVCTISVGDGPMINYLVQETTNVMHLSKEDEIIGEIMLKIVYNNTSKNGMQRTTHEYFQRKFEQTETSGANETKSTSVDFKYECYDTERIVTHNEIHLKQDDELEVEFDKTRFKEEIKEGIEKYKKSRYADNKTENADIIATDEERFKARVKKEFLNRVVDRE